MTSVPGLRAHNGDRSAVLDWLLWAGYRAVGAAIVLGKLPWPQWAISDIDIYTHWATDSLAMGRFPNDVAWQYPPLAGPLLLLGEKLPGGWGGYVLLFLAFDAAIMFMVSRHARDVGDGSGRRLWALLPVVVGLPLLFSRFDVVPTAFAVAAVLLASRPIASGVAAAVGAWIKVWPALAVAGLRRRDLPAGILGLLTASMVLAGLTVATTNDSMAFLHNQHGRGLQIESVMAWPFLVARQMGMQLDVRYEYGSVQVSGSGVALVAAVLPWVTLVLLALVAVQRLRGRLDDLLAADVALAAVLFSVTTSRVLSPQYYIWLFGLAAVALCHPDTRMRRTIALLVGASIAAEMLYPWFYEALIHGSVVALCLQTARVGLTVTATITAALVLLRAQRADDDYGRRLSRASSPA